MIAAPSAGEGGDGVKTTAGVGYRYYIQKCAHGHSEEEREQ